MDKSPLLYRFGDFELDVGARLLRVAATRASVTLSARHFDTLVFLLDRRGRLVEKQELLKGVWSNCIVEDANLAQAISVIRRALRDDAKVPRYIATVPRRGYQFVAAVESIEPEPDVGRPTEGVRRSTALMRSARSVSTWVTSGALILGIGMLTILFAWRESAIVSLPAPPQRSIAVLPFRDSDQTSPGETLDYLQREIASRLTRANRVVVVTPSYPNSHVDDPETAQRLVAELGVDLVLRGELHRQDASVRLVTEVLQGETGGRLWSQEFDGGRDESRSAHRNMAVDVVDAIHPLITSFLVPNRSVARLSNSQAANEWFVRAREAFGRQLPTHGFEYIDRAIALDPTFAHALALKSVHLAYGLINADSTAPIDPAEISAIEEQALGLAADALAVNSEIGLAWVTRAVIHQNHWRWSMAREAYEKAVELSPHSSETLLPYGMCRLFQGDFQESLRIATSILSSDPENAMARWLEGWSLGLLQRHAESRSAYEEALRLEPTRVMFQRSVAYAAISAGDRSAAEKALRATEQLLAKHPSSSVWLPGLAYGYSRLGLHDDVRRVVKSFEDSPDSYRAGVGDRATIYLALRDRENVAALLRAAVSRIRAHTLDEGYWALMGIRYNNLRDPMLEEPALKMLREQLAGQ